MQINLHAPHVTYTEERNSLIQIKRARQLGPERACEEFARTAQNIGPELPQKFLVGEVLRVIVVRVQTLCVYKLRLYAAAMHSCS
jgi:hypothetical protein